MRQAVVQRSYPNSTFEGRDPLGDGQRSARTSTCTSSSGQEKHLLCCCWQTKRFVKSPRESRCACARARVLNPRYVGAHVSKLRACCCRAVMVNRWASTHVDHGSQWLCWLIWVAGEQEWCLAWLESMFVTCCVACPVPFRVHSCLEKSVTFGEAVCGSILASALDQGRF